MISSSEFEGNKLTTQRQVDAKCSCIANVVGKSQIECETFTSFPGNHPEELERGNNKLIVSLVVLPGQAEVDEAEGPARGIADLEVGGHKPVVQVFVVVLARVNDIPRSRRLRPQGPTT